MSGSRGSSYVASVSTTPTHQAGRAPETQGARTMASALDKMMELFFGSDPESGQSNMVKYQENPDAYADEHGFADCTPEEINEAVSLMYEKGPVSQGATVLGGTQVAGTSVSVA